jgi:hypothetical protein
VGDADDQHHEAAFVDFVKDAVAAHAHRQTISSPASFVQPGGRGLAASVSIAPTTRRFKRASRQSSSQSNAFADRLTT